MSSKNKGTENILEQVLANCHSFPEKIALKDSFQQLTYSEFYDKINDYCQWLSQSAFQPGQVAIIQLPNRTITVCLMFAFFKLGIIPLFVAPTLREREVTHLIQLSDADYYFYPENYTDFDYEKQANNIYKHSEKKFSAFKVSETKIKMDFAGANITISPKKSLYMLMMTSSGSTGLPKIIPVTAEQMFFRSTKWKHCCHFNEDSRFMAYLSIMYPMTLHSPGILCALYSGAEVHLTDRGEMGIRECLKSMQQNKITHTALVPTFAHEFVTLIKENNYDLSSMRVVEIGGEPLSEDLAKQIREAFNCKLFEIFGMTEGFSFNTIRSDIKFTNDDIYFEFRLVPDEDDESTWESKNKGELLLKNDGIFSGYFNQDNSQFFTDDDYFISGDIVELTKDNQVITAYRKKNVINKTGNKISSYEIEELLLSITGIKQTAVVGINDSALGQAIFAFIVGKKIPDEIIKKHFITSGAPDFKIPDKVIFLDEIPLNSRLKIDRIKLVELGEKY